MPAGDLESVARSLVAPGKGILAADESAPTIEKRFKTINVPPPRKIGVPTGSFCLLPPEHPSS
jgi:hypothetical protein